MERKLRRSRTGLIACYIELLVNMFKNAEQRAVLTCEAANNSKYTSISH